jgi:DNA-binding beta-propeller fold protein YncE
MQEANENPEPGGNIALGPAGRLYLADTYNNRVRLIDLVSGIVTTVAGNGTAAYSGDGGPAVAAALYRPRDVELGPDGRLYIADTDNHRVRAVDLTTGIIETVVGTGRAGFSGDGQPARAAELHRPFGIAFDSAGNLIVTDTFNNRVRRVVR